jgi:hypothetical protein
MSRLMTVLASLALIVAIAAIPTAAQARGNGGGAGAHRGCVSNNGIPLDDGQSVLVDGVWISCNNGTVCHFAKGQFPLCYISVQADEAIGSTGGNGGGSAPKGKNIPVVHKGTAAAQR